MAVVRFYRTSPISGNTAPAVGWIEFVPTGPWVITGDPDNTVLPLPFSAQLVGGRLDVDLAATSSTWVWKITEHIAGMQTRTWYAQVPPTGPVDDTDLVKVNPGTLLPGASADPVFTASASTLASGAPATASLSGSYPHLAISLGIPAGPAGPAGPVGPTGPEGPAGPEGPQGLPGAWSAAAEAAALGFWPVYSETQPTSTTMYGVPVVWMTPAQAPAPVPAVPQAPAWSDTNTTATIPTGQVGIEYKNKDTGAVLPQGNVVPGVKGQDFTIEAVALPGYVLPTTFVWKHRFLDPAKSTLVASETFTGPQVPSIVGRSFNNALGGSGSLLWRGLESTANPLWVPPNVNWLGHGQTGYTPDGSGKLKYIPVGASINPTLTTSTSGGTLPAATYFYMVTAVMAVGETGITNQKSVATTGSTSSNTLTWAAVAGATSIRIWRATASGQEKLLATIAGGSTTYVDDGSAAIGTQTPPYLGDDVRGYVGTMLGSSWQRAVFDASGVASGSEIVVRFRASGGWTPDLVGYYTRVKATSVEFAIGNDLANQTTNSVATFSFAHSPNGTWDTYIIGDTLTAVAPTGQVYTTTVKPYLGAVSGADRNQGNGIVFQPTGAAAMANLKVYEVGV